MMDQGVSGKKQLIVDVWSALSKSDVAVNTTKQRQQTHKWHFITQDGSMVAWYIYYQ